MTKEKRDLTKREEEIIFHASGLHLGNVQYRTHYCINHDNQTLCRLVKKGMFSGPHFSDMHGARLAVFHLTEKGIEEAWRIKKEGKRT